jgi:hypothetical protein
MRSYLIAGLASLAIAVTSTFQLHAQATARPATISTYYSSAYSAPVAQPGLYYAPMTTTYYPAPTYYPPIFSPYYSPPTLGYDPGFRSFYYTPGPANFYAGLNTYYASPRYWNYYYPGY